MEQRGGDPIPIGAEQRRQLAERYGLSEEELGKLIEDLWLLSGDTVAAYVRRRHEELQKEGAPNERAFTILEREVAEGRFASPPLSQRQIRRIIYG
jgi:hypothetical protein